MIASLIAAVINQALYFVAAEFFAVKSILRDQGGMAIPYSLVD